MSDFSPLGHREQIDERELCAQGYGMLEFIHVPIVEKYLEQAYGGIVVDIGCGSGDHMLKARWARVFCAIEKCHEVAAGIIRSGSNTYTLIADAKSVPLPTSSADVILAFGLFGNLDIYPNGTTDFNGTLHNRLDTLLLAPQLQETFAKRSLSVIQEISRLLKSNGVVLISNHTRRQPPRNFRCVLNQYFSSIELLLGVNRYLMVARK